MTPALKQHIQTNAYLSSITSAKLVATHATWSYRTGRYYDHRFQPGLVVYFLAALVIILIVLYYYAVKTILSKKNYLVLALALSLSMVFTLVIAWPSECASAPSSEACVWGKAFFPLTGGITILASMPILYLLFTGINALRKRHQRRSKGQGWSAAMATSDTRLPLWSIHRKMTLDRFPPLTKPVWVTASC